MAQDTITTSNITASLADFALRLRADEVSAGARKRVVDALADVVGCAIAGSREPVARVLLDTIATSPAPSTAAPCPLIGTPLFAAPVDAALFNGTIAHALDYDDFSHPAYSHPSVVLFPALFALASACGASGRELITAYIVGLQVYGKFGRALNTSHYEAGWHATSTFGSVAAAAAGARLCGLTAEQFTTAIGIAASSSAGLRTNFGTMTKPLHAGQAARNAVLAIRLAQAGATASADPLGGACGFLSTFKGVAGIRAEALARWDDALEIETDFGLNLKPFPACAATHTAIEAVLDLVRAHEFAVADVEAIRVGASKVAFLALQQELPLSSLQAKFSMAYCVAIALLDGEVRIGSFGLERIRSPEVQDLMPRISMERDERVWDHSELGSVVTVRLRDGRILEKQLMIAVGKPERWFTSERLRAKFDDCAGAAMTAEDREALFGKLQSIEQLPAAMDALAI